MKTESSRRTLPLLPDVEEILLKHKAKQEAYQKQFRRGYSRKYLNMICVNQLGELLKPNYITARFPEVLKKYGLRSIRFHDLRHTCASLLVGQNINMKVIQIWLGHSNMSTTADIYSHLDSNAKSEAGRAIDGLLGIKGNED
jgi:integrase